MIVSKICCRFSPPILQHGAKDDFDLGISKVWQVESERRDVKISVM